MKVEMVHTEGARTKQYAAIMSISITLSDIFASTSSDGLTNDQIAEELENYMEDQFNTEIQDESTPQIAAELLRFYQYCTAGNESTARVEFDELPALQSWLVPGQSSQSIRHQPSPVQRDECSNEDMDVDENQEEDGWTTVTKRRNR